MATTAKTAKSATAPVDASVLARNIAIATAEAWRPSVSEVRTATLVKVRKGEGEYGVYPILVLENDENGVFAFHAFHTLDQESLGELKPKRGDVLTFFYGGKKETNKSAKAFADGAIEEKDRKYYHHSLIFSGDGSDIDAGDEYSFDE